MPQCSPTLVIIVNTRWEPLGENNRPDTSPQISGDNRFHIDDNDIDNKDISNIDNIDNKKLGYSGASSELG